MLHSRKPGDRLMFNQLHQTKCLHKQIESSPRTQSNPRRLSAGLPSGKASDPRKVTSSSMHCRLTIGAVSERVARQFPSPDLQVHIAGDAALYNLSQHKRAKLEFCRHTHSVFWSLRPERFGFRRSKSGLEDWALCSRKSRPVEAIAKLRP